MAAIVTDTFRRNNARSFISDILDVDNNYYVGIGKSDKWIDDEEILDVGNIPVPHGVPSDDTTIKSNLVTLIKVTDKNAKIVIPHVKWQVGKYYKAYNPTDPQCFYPETAGGIEINPCYAVVKSRIYLCLQRPLSLTGAPVPASKEPSQNDYIAFDNRDGYVWILVDNLSTTAATIVTEQFISLNLPGTAAADNADNIRQEGGGIIYGFTVTSGGTSYANEFEITFVGTYESGASFEILCPAKASGGVLQSVMLPANWGYTALASKGFVDGYFKTPTVGSGAVIVPHIAPLQGFAAVPEEILPAWFAAIAVDLKDDVSTDGFYISYRQISVLRNVEATIPTGPVDTLKAVSYLVLETSPDTIPITGDIITFGDTGIRAYIDTYSPVRDPITSVIEHRLYFHQNYVTGFGAIAAIGTFTDSRAETRDYKSIVSGEYVANSGQVVFTENRKPINRQAGQTEELKIIIQF